MRKKIGLLVWGMFPVILGISLVALTTLAFKNTDFAKIWESKSNTATVSQSFISAKDAKPKYFYLNNGEEEPKVGAAAYLVGDLNTGEVILAKNQDKKFPIASVSKLMTALVADLISPPDDVVEISKRSLATYGSNGNLRDREKIQTKELLYPLLLESSNDAAEALAEHYDRESFIEKMNRQAETLKMTLTSFSDPSGLSPENQSSVSDLFRLAGYLKSKKPHLLELASKRSFYNGRHSWSNNSQFLKKEGYLGGKSGFINESLQTGLSFFEVPLSEEGARPIAIALLRSQNRANDVQSILNFLKQNIYYGGASDAKREWVQEKLNVPSIKDPDFIALAFLGDIMANRGVRSSVIKNFAGDYSALFEKMGVLKEFDVVFANLEGPSSDKGTDGKNLYSFRMDPTVIPALKGAGVSVLSIANNHMADWGKD